MTLAQTSPVQLIVGAGCSQQLGANLARGSVLLLTTAGMIRRNVTSRLIASSGPLVSWTIRCVDPNPEMNQIDQLADNLRGHRWDMIVALGGGSVIDCAKILSLMLPDASHWKLIDGLLNGNLFSSIVQLPLICLPTTAGTGAEVTPFATVWDSSNKQKRSLSGENLYPRLALLDPELTLTLGPDNTLFGALDAISHALETCWNRHATVDSGALALKALKKIEMHLTMVLSNPSSLLARAEMQEASLLAGLAMKKNRTALAHAISYPLTAHFGVPHGLACSFTLPTLMRLVESKKAWETRPPTRSQRELVSQLESFKLGHRVLKFCPRQQVLDLVAEMVPPDRIGNFVLPVSQDDLIEIVDASLP
jgi:phosphonate metabolism-associated iron-containing alcohol dehydrogenase